MRRSRLLLALAGVLAVLAVSATPASADTLTRGGDCALIPPLKTAAPIGNAPCPGVRPGALVESDVGTCTMNYVFSGSDGRTYVGTAGHCIIEAPSTGGDFPEMQWGPGAGPEARDGDGNRIGEFAYAVLRDSEEADFSLIRLDPSVSANPQMCFFGGPTGLNTTNPPLSEPTLLNYYGNGILIGNLVVANVPTLPARSALALGMPSDTHVYAEGLVLPGDSGSAVNSSDGRAIGVAVTTGIHSSSIGTDGIDAGLIGIMRLGPQVQRAQGFTGVTYTLQTAPLL